LKLLRIKKNTEKYLVPTPLSSLQKELLNLLKIIDKICRKNDIEYWLDFGTLLGAVRHKGFIPWDDDVDICVPTDHYPKLLKLLHQEKDRNSDIFLFYYKNKNTLNTYEKLGSTRIAMREDKVGLFACHIDIFAVKLINPKDENSDKILTNTANFFCSNGKDYLIDIDKKYIKNNLKNALRAKSKFMQYYNNEYAPFCNRREKDSLLTYTFSIHINHLYCDIFPLQQIEFEGQLFFAPKNTDKYLVKYYGDYMTPPPKYQQLPKHSKGIYICKNKEFILNETFNANIKHNKKFYTNRIGFFIRKLSIYEKLREINFNRRKLRKAKKDKKRNANQSC
jgi:lipopolysaccharide cholinephosphotransferase